MTPIHFTTLKHISRSPAHYKYFSEQEFKRTASMHVGSCVDALLFETQPVLHYEGVRRGKAWEEAKEENPDALFASASEYPRILGMVKSVRQNRNAMRVLEGERQQTLNWKIAGRDCEGTPDVFCQDHLTDLKTTMNAFPPKFERDALWRGYHAQLAWYRNGLVQSGRPEPRHCFIVSVESSPPYLTVVRELTDRALEMGERLWRLWFEELRVCEDSNEWPGYAQGVVPLDVPDDDFSLTIGGEEVDV